MDQSGKVLKIAHRGFSSRYPENTLPAFSGAIESGADMIEFDVHLSMDNVPVIIHDYDISRTSNGHGYVKEMTYTQLCRYNYNNGFDTAKTVVIPILRQVLELAKDKVLCNIELKNLPYVYPGLEEIVIRNVVDCGMEDQVIISSFNHVSLQKVTSIHKGIKIGMLYDALWVQFEQELMQLRPYSIHPGIDSFNPDQAKIASGYGIQVFVWVAGKKDDVKSLLDCGLVNGIMVNDLYLFS